LVSRELKAKRSMIFLSLAVDFEEGRARLRLPAGVSRLRDTPEAKQA